MMSSDRPSSTWSFGSKSNARGSPSRRISTLSDSSSPSDVVGRRLGHGQHQRVELGLDLFVLVFEGFDRRLDLVELLLDALGLGREVLGRLAVGDRLLVIRALGVAVERDLTAQLLLFLPQLVALLLDLAPPGVDGQQPVDVAGALLAFGRPANQLRIFTDDSDVQHRSVLPRS